MPFDGLSALTQLTRFATEYASVMQRQQLCNELAHLTRLQELEAPIVLQSEGERLRPAILNPLEICTMMRPCHHNVSLARVDPERQMS